MKKIILLLPIAGLIYFAPGCKKKDPTTYDCSGTTPTYTVDVKTIMDANCATSGCHSSGSKANGIDLSSYNSTKSEAGNKAFLGSMQHLSGYKAMPEGGSKLSDDQLKTVGCWIQNGMPE